MSTVFICCKMIEKEFKKAYADIGSKNTVYWLDAGLHSNPVHLHTSLQNTLDSLPEDVDRVIMAYGLCGKAAIGLKTRNFDMIMPKTDDCIALLLGSNDEKKNNKSTIFVTDTWISGERSMLNEYNYLLNRYGQQKGDRIFKRQFMHYTTLGVLDTGCYNIDDVIAETKEFSDMLSLSTKVIPTTYNYLESLINFKYEPDDFDDSKYLYVEKNSEVSEGDFFNFYTN